MGDSWMKIGARATGGVGAVDPTYLLQRKAEGIQLAKEVQGPDRTKQVQKAAEDFEALMLKQMMNAMWSTVPQGGMLSGSREEEMYRDMLNESVAAEVAKGQGIGIKQVIARELSKEEK